MGLTLPWGLGFLASGSPVQTGGHCPGGLPILDGTVSLGCSSPYSTSPPNSLCCPHLLCPQHSVLPLHISSCPWASLPFSAALALVGWAASTGTAPVAMGRSRGAAVLGLLVFGGVHAVGAGVAISPHPVCVRACAHTRAHTRTCTSA